MPISLVAKLKVFAEERYPNWVNGGEFERLAMGEGRKASNASRRLREMFQAGILDRRINGKSVEYRTNPNYSPPEEKKLKMIHRYTQKVRKDMNYDRALVEKIQQMTPFKVSRGEKSIQNNLI